MAVLATLGLILANLKAIIEGVCQEPVVLPCCERCAPRRWHQGATGGWAAAARRLGTLGCSSGGGTHMASCTGCPEAASSGCAGERAARCLVCSHRHGVPAFPASRPCSLSVMLCCQCCCVPSAAIFPALLPSLQCSCGWFARSLRCKDQRGRAPGACVGVTSCSACTTCSRQGLACSLAARALPAGQPAAPCSKPITRCSHCHD